jgi:hypothetical protein
MYCSIHVSGTDVAVATGTDVAVESAGAVAVGPDGAVAVGAGDVAVGALVAVGSSPPAHARATTATVAANTAINGLILNTSRTFISRTPFLGSNM